MLKTNNNNREGCQELKRKLTVDLQELEDEDEEEPETEAQESPQSDSQNDDSQHQQDQCDQQGDSNKPKRNPFCSRCRNHGRSAQVKGHKRHCEYRNCQCEGCRLVEARQIISAAQIKKRREQKQDEECGRKIEISPPMLLREPSKDPATLIAKTLIGATKSPLANVSALHQNGQSHNHHHHHHHHQQQANTVLPTTSSADSINSLASTNPITSNHHHYPSNGSNGGHSIHKGHLMDLNNQHGHCSPTNSSASTNTMQMFHFPNSMVSLGHPNLSIASSYSLPLPPVPLMTNSTANSSQLPSIRDQLAMVEEIHQTVGPLAIYAWLSAEQFDLQKVRGLIEISRPSYKNLLDLLVLNLI